MLLLLPSLTAQWGSWKQNQAWIFQTAMQEGDPQGESSVSFVAGLWFEETWNPQGGMAIKWEQG